MIWCNKSTQYGFSIYKIIFCFKFFPCFFSWRASSLKQLFFSIVPDFSDKSEIYRFNFMFVDAGILCWDLDLFVFQNFFFF
jgi:hypothetical protein